MRSRQIWHRVFVATTLLFLAVVGTWAQKVETGYEKSANFSQYKTYAWVPRTTPATNPALAAIVASNIDYELTQKGLRRVDSNPDLLVACYRGTDDVKGGWAAVDPSYAATGGVPLAGDDMWVGSLPPTPVPQVMEGSITVDLVDAKQHRIVWRATAKGKMDYDKRSKLLEQANKAVEEMFKKYPPQEKEK